MEYFFKPVKTLNNGKNELISYLHFDHSLPFLTGFDCFIHKNKK